MRSGKQFARGLYDKESLGTCALLAALESVEYWIAIESVIIMIVVQSAAARGSILTRYTSSFQVITLHKTTDRFVVMGEDYSFINPGIQFGGLM